MANQVRITYKQMLTIMVNIVMALRENNILLPRSYNDFRIKSKSFKNGGKLDKKYTPYGKDVHPDLFWTGVPQGTKSFAIIVDDPDTPSGKVFTHWAIKNIPINYSKLDEGEVVGEELKNSWGFTKYSGPKPPSGTHRYYFKIYAIREDRLVARTLNAIRIEINAKKLAEASIMGTFSAQD